MIIRIVQRYIFDITLARMLIFLAVACLVTYVYLLQTNWFFDRELMKLSNPLLREVMETGKYRMDKNASCASYEPMQLHYDTQDLLLKLIAKDDNITITALHINKCPRTALRMNGDMEIDSAFNMKDSYPCDLEKRFKGLVQVRAQIEEMLIKANNHRFYNIYTDDKCVNHNIFDENIAKYKNKVFGSKTISLPHVPTGQIWFWKKRNYYYLVIEANGQQAHSAYFKGKDPIERYFVFKKFTVKQLKKFDNGSYWRLITDYGIKID